MKFYSVSSCIFIVLGFAHSIIFDPSTMSGDQLIAETVICAGAAIASAILAKASKK